MKQDKKRRGSGCLITIGILVVLGILFWLLGIPLVNRTASRYVDQAIQDALGDSQAPQITYRNLVIDATKGDITLEGLAFALDEQSLIQAQTVTLRVKPADLAVFALGQSSGIEHAEIDLEQFSYNAPDMRISVGDAELVLEGAVEVNDPERSTIHNATLKSKEAEYTDLQTNLTFKANTLDVAVTGRITIKTFEKDVDGILDDIGYIDIAATEGTLVGDAQIAEQMALFAAMSPWIADTSNWGFDSLQAEARTLEHAIAVDSFAIHAPLMDATGSAEIPREKGSPVSLLLDVHELNSDVRNELSPLLAFFGQQIPEGSFTFDFDWSGIGIPTIVLR